MGVTEIHVVGVRGETDFAKCANVVSSLEIIYPNQIKVDVQEHASPESFDTWSNGGEPGFLRALDRSSLNNVLVWIDDDQILGGFEEVVKYVNGVLLRGPFHTRIARWVPDDKHIQGDYDYDLVVIGGGSGGLACSKKAANLGARVCVLDYVKPSPHGSSWGLGGTCVNVGCIPKKLMHRAALIGDTLQDEAKSYGWTLGSGGNGQTFKHSWEELVTTVANHIGSLNFKYRVDLRDNGVKYENYRGSFIDAHTLELRNERKKSAPVKRITAARVVIAVGGRPRALACAGGELAITSDDIFSLPTPPGKTLVVGASYVALECAGFLHAVGFDVTVMVRSILLRGFDRQMSELIGKFMQEHEGIKFIYECVPSAIKKTEAGRLHVTWQSASSQSLRGGQEAGEDEFDTVLAATGRVAELDDLNLDAAGVKVDAHKKRVIVTDEQTTAANIYAIGDCIDGPELTPVAIQAGQYLSRRLFGGSREAMDYTNVCTTVFTPLEYGACGMSEETAKTLIGEEDLEIFHKEFYPLEWTVAEMKSHAPCYIKLICNKADNLRVVGLHYCGPNAGEVTQGFGVAIKRGATYSDVKETVGIHPTCAEEFTTLTVTKSSGASAEASGC